MDWQFLIVIAIIGLAGGFILRPLVSRRRKSARAAGQCGAGCGCSGAQSDDSTRFRG